MTKTTGSKVPDQNRDLSIFAFPIRWKGNSLRDLRNELKLSQREIADALGVAKSTISNVENERNANPYILTIYGMLLERYYAYENGYLPAYRKIGTDEKIEIDKIIFSMEEKANDTNRRTN